LLDDTATVPPTPIVWIHRPHPSVIEAEAPLERAYTLMLAEQTRSTADRAAAFAGRASSRSRQWRPEEALADIDAALRLARGSALLHLERARLLGQLGRPAEAAAPLEQAFRNEPESSRTAAVLGILRFQEGRCDAAAEALDFHLEAEASPPVSLRLLRACAQTRSGRRPNLSGLGTFRDPWPGAVASFLARRIGREAFLALARAEDRAPPADAACVAWFHLGQRALLEGDRERAARDFLGALGSGATPLIEYRLAAAELIRLGVLDPRSLPGGRAPDPP
jgi:lipoprotein NlpI